MIRGHSIAPHSCLRPCLLRASAFHPHPYPRPCPRPCTCHCLLASQGLHRHAAACHLGSQAVYLMAQSWVCRRRRLRGGGEWQACSMKTARVTSGGGGSVRPAARGRQGWPQGGAVVAGLQHEGGKGGLRGRGEWQACSTKKARVTSVGAQYKYGPHTVCSHIRQ